MSIGEQVKELREYSNVSLYARENRARELLKEAADTIESLSAKLKAANMDRSAEDCGGWIPCSERLPETDGIYWAVVTLPKTVEKGYSIMEAEEWYANYTLEELCEWEKTAPKHTGFARFENGDWRTHTKRRFTNVIAWQPIVEPEPYHEP